MKATVTVSFDRLARVADEAALEFDVANLLGEFTTAQRLVEILEGFIGVGPATVDPCFALVLNQAAYNAGVTEFRMNTTDTLLRCVDDLLERMRNAIDRAGDGGVSIAEEFEVLRRFCTELSKSATSMDLHIHAMLRCGTPRPR